MFEQRCSNKGGSHPAAGAAGEVSGHERHEQDVASSAEPWDEEDRPPLLYQVGREPEAAVRGVLNLGPQAGTDVPR